MDVRNLRNQHGLAFVRAQTETAVIPFVLGSIGSTIAQFFCRISLSVEKKAFPNS
jgi:phage terminase Nu1 subunit (DNA packaging protein)